MSKTRAGKNTTPQLQGEETYAQTPVDGFSILARIIARFHANKRGQSMLKARPFSDTSGVKVGKNH